MSFRLKIILGIALIQAVFLSTIVWSSLNYLKSSSLENISYEAKSASSLFVTATKDAVISRDLDSLAASVNDLLENKHVVYVRIYHRTTLLMEAGSLMSLSSPFVLDKEGLMPDDGVYDISSSILESGYNFGRVELGFDVGPINKRLGKANAEITTIAVLELFFCGLFSWMLGVQLTKYLSLLSGGSKELERGNLGYQIPVSGRDELADVAMSFNNMSSKVSDLLEVSKVQNIKIKERESLLNQILQGMPFGVLLCNYSTKDIVFSNNMFSELMSVQKGFYGDLSGLNCFEVYDLMRQSFVNVTFLENFIGESIKNNVRSKSIELELVNGKFVEIDFLPLAISDDEIIYYLLSFVDVTKSKHEEEAIRQRSNQLSSVFNLNPDGLVQFGSDHTVIRVNSSFCILTGLSSSVIVGRDLEWLDDCLRSNISEESEIPDIKYDTFDGPSFSSIVLKVGGGLVYLDRIICFNENNIKKGGIVYYRNVSEQKKLELMKSEFLSTAAHELRTPMANVYGYSELLLNTDYSEEMQSELVDIIHKNSGRLVFILNDLLDLARIESKGAQDMVFEYVSLEGLITDCVRMFEADDKRVINIEVTEVPLIRCDRNKVVQVVNNIIGNALKYSQSDTPIKVSLSVCDCTGSDGPSIIVEDKGMGMSPEEVSRVFERFYRVDSSGQVPGTGLGMSIVKEIMDMHHGKIEIESHKGVGTKVIICFPYVSYDKED